MRYSEIREKTLKITEGEGKLEANVIHRIIQYLSFAFSGCAVLEVKLGIRAVLYLFCIN